MVTELIKQEKFKEASSKIDFDHFKECFSEIQEAAFDEEAMIYYDFMTYLLDNGHDTAMMHYYTSELMVTALNVLPEAYDLAFKHARKAIALDPQDYALKEYMLLFYDIPDQLLDRDTAKRYAQEVLRINPYSEAARRVL